MGKLGKKAISMLLAVSLAVNSVSGAAPLKTYEYGYEDSSWKDKLTSWNGQAITYDEIGNPLQYRDAISMSWKYGRTLETISNQEYSIHRLKI